MELPDFLRAYADPDLRDELPMIDYTASMNKQEDVDAYMHNGGHSAEHVAEHLAYGDELIAKSKEIRTLGAFDGRSGPRRWTCSASRSSSSSRPTRSCLPSASAKKTTRWKYVPPGPTIGTWPSSAERPAQWA